jgi:3-keto-5-aminohexanoate cleavage enzyme
MRKVWIEAASNCAWSSALQPGIPDTIEAIIAEGVAYARAGACIIHAHAYDRGGPQTFDWEVYARIIEGICAQVEVSVYPSYPSILTTSIQSSLSEADGAARFAHIEALAARGLIEFAVIDPGSVNFTRIAATTRVRPAGTYLKPAVIGGFPVKHQI